MAAAHHRRDLSDAQLLEQFTGGQDQAAFTTLVRRHGAMVLGVCRHVLQHQQDAEDAFQVTFLVLARHAATVRKRASLASWLHGVAYRTALAARRAAARRRAHERRAEVVPRRNAAGGLEWREAQAALEEEVGRLSERYKAAFVLCCLEGRSQAEVARELGLKEGTVSSRLGRARKQLQDRLARRGIVLTALLAATAEADGVVPAALAASTARAAAQYAAGEAAAAGLLSPTAATLLQAVAHGAFLTKFKAALAVLVLLGGLAGAAAGFLAADRGATQPGDPGAGGGGPDGLGGPEAAVK
jgi:RNA polymerase sigma factor (sigma-70 family)